MKRNITAALNRWSIAIVLGVASIAVRGVQTELSVPDCNSKAEVEKDTRPSIPYVATPSDAVRDMLWMASAGKDDVVYDLGSGDGRIVIAAARDFGVQRAVGIETDPKLIRQSRQNAADFSGRVDFIEGDLFQQDFGEASVVTLFLGHEPNIRLRSRLLADLKPGTRIISHQFGMGEWEPDKLLRVRTAVLGMYGTFIGPFTLNPHVPDYVGNERYYDTVDDIIFCWIIPASAAGTWCGKIKSRDGPRDCQITLRQRLSKLTGTLQVSGKSELTGDVAAELWGDHLRFASTPHGARSRLRFDGHIHEDTMRGTLEFTDEVGKTQQAEWQARRKRVDLTGTWEWPCFTGERTLQLRIERCDGTYTATYLDGTKPIPITDFYDHGGGLYFTLPIGRERHGGFRVAEDAGWLLATGTLQEGLLKGRIEFHPSGDDRAFDDIFENKPPRPVIREWSARRVGASAAVTKEIER